MRRNVPRAAVGARYGGARMSHHVKGEKKAAGSKAGAKSGSKKK